jgi:DNA-binding response OmpR family regulator
MLANGVYDVAILDRMLPDVDGLDVLREIRGRGISTPVIILSALGSTDERVRGLSAGADDYLPKPYSMKELLSRINALIRRTYGSSTSEKTVTFGSVCVSITSRTVTRDGKPVNLSLREFDLLAYLCEHKNEAITKDKLISGVWGAFSMVEPSTLTVHIRWLREKLEDDPNSPEIIKTVWKVGYRFGERHE